MGSSRKGEECCYTLTVIGEGTVLIQPDTASAVVGVATENKNLVEGQKQNAKAASAIIASLTEAGIRPEHIRTSDYRIESLYDYKDGTQFFRGYKITHLLKVKITDLEKIGAIVDKAVMSGANYVSDIHFSAEGKVDFYKEALRLAVENAYEKAVEICSALHVMLDRVPLSIKEGRNAPGMFSDYSHGPMVKGVSSPPIQTGELSVEAAVTAVYQYSQSR